MPYVTDATDVTQPDTATVKASNAAPEIRAIKVYMRDVLLAGISLKAPAASPVFSGAAVFNGSATFNVAPTVPTQPPGTADATAASTAFVAAVALSSVMPGAATGKGLSVSSNGADAAFRLSAPDAISILNFLGA